MMSNNIENRKNKLLKASDEFENKINEDLSVVADVVSEHGGKILIIGGALLLSYLGVRAILSKKRDKNEPESDTKKSRISARNIFMTSLSDKAALVLLALIREYIVKLLNDSAEGND